MLLAVLVLRSHRHRHSPTMSLRSAAFAPADLATDPRVLLPAQLAAYLLVFGVLWRLFAITTASDFFARSAGAGRCAGPSSWPPECCSRWPSSSSRTFCPAPPELPIDKMLRTASDAWLMTVFGVLDRAVCRGSPVPRTALSGARPPRRSAAFPGCHLGALRRHPCPATGGSLDPGHLHHVVGAVLTLVRWRFRSLASSTLVHVGYNGALFAALFVQTRGFTNFSPH